MSLFLRAKRGVFEYWYFGRVILGGIV